MPEIDHYQNDISNAEGFMTIETAIFKLLSCVWADKEYQKLSAKKMYTGIEKTFDELTINHILKYLIEVATLYRLQEYQRLNDPKYKKKYKPNEKVVGILHQPEGSKGVPLNMLEACHKIIHAEKVNYDLRKLPKIDRQYIYPKFYIYGKKYNKKWKAVLDLIEFCEWAHRFEEDPFKF